MKITDKILIKQEVLNIIDFAYEHHWIVNKNCLLGELKQFAFKPFLENGIEVINLNHLTNSLLGTLIKSFLEAKQINADNLNYKNVLIDEIRDDKDKNSSWFVLDNFWFAYSINTGKNKDNISYPKTSQLKTILGANNIIYIHRNGSLVKISNPLANYLEKGHTIDFIDAIPCYIPNHHQNSIFRKHMQTLNAIKSEVSRNYIDCFYIENERFGIHFDCNLQSIHSQHKMRLYFGIW